MAKQLVISSAPHVHGKNSTRRTMLDVLIALMPALAVATYVYGERVLVVTAFSIACCIFFEWAIQKFFLKGGNTIKDLSAIVTGTLFAFNLPSEIPLWLIAIGCLVAIGIGKMTFGGLGKNPFNPALVGRVFLLIAFPVALTTFNDPIIIDVASGATPLTLAKEALASGQNVSQVVSQLNMGNIVLGFKGGSFGEISIVALLLGFLWLLLRKVISWRIPVTVLGTMAIFGGIMWGLFPESYMSPLFHILSGGAILGAVFMATDYVTSPMTKKGAVIFAIGIGLITMCIRYWGAYPEGMSFAILIMNAFVPLIDKWILPKRFGVVKQIKTK